MVAGSDEHLITHSECQLFALSYEELGRRYGLLAELRARVGDVRQRPSTLVALLQREKPSAPATKLAAASGGGGAPGAEAGGAPAPAGAGVTFAVSSLSSASRFAARAHQRIAQAIKEDSPALSRAPIPAPVLS